jgi:protease IV
MKFLSTLLASILGTLVALGFIFFVFLMFIFALAASSDGTPSVQLGSVLVVELNGAVPELVSDDPLMKAFGGAASYDLLDLTEGLKKAAVDDRIDAVWLQVKSAPGSWATLQEIRGALLDFKESGKPVYASSDDYSMDEAAYYLASVADSVFSGPQTFFELNGFYLAAEFYQGLLEKLSVEPQIVRVGRYKSAVEPFERADLSPENEEQLTSLLTSWNQVFMADVAKVRNMQAEELQSIAQDSAIISAADAYRVGLLDGLLYRDQVVDVIKNRLGFEEEEDLREISLSTYARVPASQAGLATGTEGEVAVVYAVGAITSGEGGLDPLLGGTVLGAESFNEAMREARESERVRAVVLRVNSPGGSAAAADAMWREIALTAAEKPLIVSMGDYAASGGYWISTPADTIVTAPLTLTGSIGVFSVFFDASGLFTNHLGITHDFVRTSPYADMLSALRPLSANEQSLLQRSTDQVYAAFLDNVARGRRQNVAQVDSVAQGRVWTGSQAVDLGLADVLGGLDTAVEIAAAKAGLEPGTYQTRILPRPKTFIEQVSESLNARANALWTRFTSSPLEQAFLKQADLIRHLAEIQGTVQARLPFDLQVR